MDENQGETSEDDLKCLVWGQFSAHHFTTEDTVRKTQRILLESGLRQEIKPRSQMTFSQHLDNPNLIKNQPSHRVSNKTSKSNRNAHHHRKSSHSAEDRYCNGDANSKCSRQNFCFNPCKYVWSTGLYVNFQEGLNLEQWAHFEKCKNFWEKAIDSKDVSGSPMRHEDPKSGGKQEIEIFPSYKTVSTCTDSDELERVGINSQWQTLNQASTQTCKRDVATSPDCSAFYDDVVSDISLSLESISSSSFHSSSDCDEDLGEE